MIRQTQSDSLTLIIIILQLNKTNQIYSTAITTYNQKHMIHPFLMFSVITSGNLQIYKDVSANHYSDS